MSFSTIQLSLEWDFYNPDESSYFPEHFLFLLIEKETNAPIYLGKAYESSVGNTIKHELLRFELTLDTTNVFIGYVTPENTTYVVAPQHLECLEHQLIQRYKPKYNRGRNQPNAYHQQLVKVVSDDFDSVLLA